MLVVYENNNEVLVCEESTEKYLLKEWFKKGGRNPENYDRTVSHGGVVEVSSRLRADNVLAKEML